VRLKQLAFTPDAVRHALCVLLLGWPTVETRRFPAVDREPPLLWGLIIINNNVSQLQIPAPSNTRVRHSDNFTVITSAEEGGYVFGAVCLSVCPTGYSQTCERILTNFFGGVGHRSRTKWYNFGGDPDHALDPGVQSPKSGSSGSAEVCSLWVHSCCIFDLPSSPRHRVKPIFAQSRL